MSDPGELDLVVKAIKSGLDGCVEWDANVADRIKLELSRHQLRLEIVQRAVIQYVRNGGKVIQHNEDREGWKDRRDYWYHVIVPMTVFPKGLFVELELRNADPELPEVGLVNTHEEL